MNGKCILGIKNLSFMGLWTELDVTLVFSWTFCFSGIRQWEILHKGKGRRNGDQNRVNFLPSVYLSSCSSIRQKELLSPTRVELCLLSVFIHFQGRSVQFVGQSESFSLMSEAHPPRLPFTPFLVWNIRNFGSGIWQKGARRGVRTLAEKPDGGIGAIQCLRFLSGV